jgi:predicted metalloprotease with PDZ domain
LRGLSSIRKTSLPALCAGGISRGNLVSRSSNKNRSTLMKPIQYSIVPKDPAAHLFEITLSVSEPAAEGQRFMLPVWIPGSYMIREFARNIVSIAARSEATGRKVALKKIDKHTWEAAPVSQGALTLTYQVYAWDLSVRAAHLDDDIGFFNGTSVFLLPLGHETAECRVAIEAPAGEQYGDWRVATALREARGTKRYGFGEYRAADYDELVDHPVTLGRFELGRFKAHGVAHDVVIAGKVVSLDMPRLTRDLEQICAAQIALFEPRTRRAPVERYVFMTLAVADGYGGLEHRASTALICNRSDLPVRGKDAMTDGYRTYLGLCSHEYFHTWNVKRIKPAAFAPYDLKQENYTTLLWLFEGFTSYYDDLVLVRSGVIARDDYLTLVGKTVAGVLRGSGRRKQSVAESSFDSWVKYYRQDENASNAIVSYYTKGSLVALAFDLAIRAATEGRKSLDDVMRALWVRYGRDFYAGEGNGKGHAAGIGEHDVEPLIREVTGVALGALFTDAVHGTRDLPLSDLLAPFGVTLEAEAGNGKPSLGARVRGGADCMLTAVHDGSAARRGGLSAGDVLVAIDGLRVTGSNLETLLARYRAGDKVEVHAFRREELRQTTVTLDAPEIARYRLAVAGNGTARRSQGPADKLRKGWIGV